MKTRDQKDTATKSPISKKKKPQLTIQIPDKSPLECKVESRKREVLGFRTTNEQLFINEHKIQPFKTAMLIDLDKVPKDIHFTNEEKLYDIPTHRPIRRVTKRSGDDSPVEVSTPKGSLLPRVSRLGVLSLFSNDAKAKPIVDNFTINKIKDESEFYSDEPYDCIIEAESNKKIQQAKITHQKLEKRRAEDLKNNFKRSISQNKLMAKDGTPERKGSATDYVHSTELFDKNFRWEWLHLVAHMIHGEESQNPDNLVAGTAFSNTEMMFAEATLNYLARVYPKGFSLSVKATLIPHTHIATAIYYTIKTPDFEIPLQFNTQTTNRPHINFQGYMNYLVEELVRHTHEINGDDTPPKQMISYTKDKLKHWKIPVITQKDAETVSISKPHEKLPTRKVVIDTETTGLFVDQGDRVVQIAGVELINGKETGKKFQQIINPERKIPKMLNYKGIHHITDASVAGKPTFKEIAKEFCEFIKDAEIIGHNLPFDITMLENELKIAKSKETLIGRAATDTLAEAQRLLPKSENPDLHSHKLDDLCDFYNINAEEREKGHDALVDSKLTGKLYLHLLKEDKKSSHSLFSSSEKSIHKDKKSSIKKYQP